MCETKCKNCIIIVCRPEHNSTKKLLKLCLIDTVEKLCSCGFNRAYKLYFPYGDFTGSYECYQCGKTN